TKQRKVFVKVPSGGGPQQESLWATPISKDTAMIDNIPFLSGREVAFRDLVRVSDSGEVLEVLERLTRTGCATYEAAKDRAKAQQEWQAIRDHFGKQDIICESATPGMFAMAIPTSVTDEEFAELWAQCPIPLSPPERKVGPG